MYIKNTILCLCSLLLSLIFSCKNGPSEKSFSSADIKVITIPEEPNEKLPIDSIISNVEFIPLETTSESLFRNAMDVVWMNGRIYVYDISLQELFTFHQDGRFINKLGRRGKGPHEYLEMRDIEIDSSGNIYVLSFKKIVVFDSAHNFKKEIAIDLPSEYYANPLQFAIAGDNGFFLYSGSFGIKSEKPMQYAVYHVNTDGSFSGLKFFPVDRSIIEKNRFFKVPYRNYYTMAPIEGNDTIYRFGRDKIDAQYYLDYGDRRMPEKFFSGFQNGEKIHKAFTTTNYVTSTGSFIDIPDYIFFAHRSDNNIWLTFYSKKSNNVVYFPFLGSDGVQNYFPRIYGGFENKFTGSIETYALLEGRKNGTFKNKFGYLPNYHRLDSIINNLNENDNPVLTLITMKKF